MRAIRIIKVCVFPPPPRQDDQTALHISSRLGKVDIVQQLLQCGASANAATTSGYTPLHLAAREGHQDVAAMLLENGASLSSATKVSPRKDLVSETNTFADAGFITVCCFSTIHHHWLASGSVFCLELNITTVSHKKS